MYRDDRNNMIRARSAFTLPELLTVVAIIILLLGLLIVVINKATGTASAARTRTLMSSINQALERYKTEIGHLPPVLDDERNFDPSVIPDPADTGTYPDMRQDWYSNTSLAEYLIGYGHHQQDGYGRIPGVPEIQSWDTEQPAFGIRHPGRDGVWNATLPGPGGSSRDGNNDFGELTDRMRRPDGTYTLPTDQPYSIDKGKVFGPYLDLADDHVMASTKGELDANDQLILYFPGDSGYDAIDPRVIVDWWLRPIRYYRRVYLPAAISHPYTPPLIDSANPGLGRHAESLADVYVLRPFELAASEFASTPQSVYVDLNDSDGFDDNYVTQELLTAQVALFSGGADRSFDEEKRVDPDAFNEDNLVELSR